MGGEIGVESELGRGSHVLVHGAPARLDAGRYRQQVRPPPALVQGPPLRVLVVDDNETNRTILEEQLAPLGLVGDQCRRRSGGARCACGVAVVRREPFAAALLDRHMPGMDGLTLARAISADPALASTPMVLLTSLGEEDRRDVQAAGFQHVLTKPVRQSQLLTMLGDDSGRAR